MPLSPMPPGGPGKKPTSRPVPVSTSPPKRVEPGMGNGASGTHVVIDGESWDLPKIKELLPRLRKDLKHRDAALEKTQKELAEAREKLKERDSDVARFKEEIHKLKSVLQATLHPDGKPDILSTIHEEAGMVGQEVRKPGQLAVKKQGVSGESSGNTHSGDKAVEIKHFPKDFK